MKHISSLILLLTLCACQCSTKKASAEILQHNSTSITFKVDDVEAVKTPLKFTLRKEASYGESLLEASSLKADQKVLVTGGHSLLTTVKTAFAEHRPLELSPDHIWLVITQSFAFHIKQNSEDYRHLMVEHEGIKDLEIHRDNFHLGRQTNNWAGVFREFSEKIKENSVGNTHQMLTQAYSTSTPLLQDLYSLTAMACYNKYFGLTMFTKCGIPSITLKGTPEDWSNLRRRANTLRRFDLNWWLTHLDPVLAQFEAASQGKVDRNFWRDIFKKSTHYNPNLINGWITVFTPFDENIRRNGMGNLSPTRVMPSMVSVDFTWDYLGIKLPMQARGGLIGIEQDPQTYALRPAVGWYIEHKKRTKYTRKESLQSMLTKQLHRGELSKETFNKACKKLNLPKEEENFHSLRKKFRLGKITFEKFKQELQTLEL